MKLSRLPKSPGVYMFKKGTKFLYIGKAINIRERVKQHKDLLNLASKVDYIETSSEVDALLLEARLIKKHQPKYNVVWKDDKNYFYVAITKESLPRVFITHQTKFKIDYIGPFVDGAALKKTLKYLRKTFPYYTAKKHPQGLCPWCHLGLCPGPDPDKKEYQRNIKNLIAVLKSGKKSVLQNLKQEMASASRKQNFEKAAKIRDQISSLEKVYRNAQLFTSPQTDVKSLRWQRFDVGKRRIEAYDVSNIQGQEATGSMVVFRNGKPDKSQYRKFKIKIQGKPNDVAMLKEVISRRFNHPEWPYPHLMLIDGGRAQLNAAMAVLNQHKSAKSASIPSVLSLAKKHNELFIEGQKKPVLLKTLPREIFNLILQLRDEAHRFAISYHRRLRTKDLLGK